MLESARPDPEWRPRPEDLPDAREIACIPRLADLATNPFFHRLNRAEPPEQRGQALDLLHGFRLALLLGYLAWLVVAVSYPESWLGGMKEAIAGTILLASLFLPFLAPIPFVLAPFAERAAFVARLADRDLSLTRLDAKDAASALIAFQRRPRNAAFHRRSAWYSFAICAAIVFHLSILCEHGEVRAMSPIIPALFLGHLGFELGIGRDFGVAGLRVLARGRLGGGFYVMPIPDLLLLLASCAPLVGSGFFVFEAYPGQRPSLVLGVALLLGALGWMLARIHVWLAKRGAAAEFELLAARLEPLIFVPHESDPARSVSEPIRRLRRQVVGTWILLGVLIALYLGLGIRSRTHSSHLARATARGMTGAAGSGYALRSSGSLDDHQRYFLRRGEVEELDAVLSHPSEFDELLADLRHPGAGRLRSLRVAAIAPDRFADTLLPNIDRLERLELDFLPGALDLAAIRDPARVPNLQTLFLGGQATLADTAPLLESRRALRVVISLPDVGDPNRFLGDSGVESVSFFALPDLQEGVIASGESVDRVGFISCPRLRRIVYERGPRLMGVARCPLLQELVVDVRALSETNPATVSSGANPASGAFRELKLLENPTLRSLVILGAPDLESIQIEACPLLERIEIEIADVPSLSKVEIEDCGALGDFAGIDFGAAQVTIDSALARALAWAMSPHPPAGR